MFFWSSRFFNDPADIDNLISGSSAFLKKKKGTPKSVKSNILNSIFAIIVQISQLDVWKRKTLAAISPAFHPSGFAFQAYFTHAWFSPLSFESIVMCSVR